MSFRAVRTACLLFVGATFVLAPSVRAQDTTQNTSTRAIEAILLGGAGFHHYGSTLFQPTASLEFIAQTSLIDLSLGYHYGFSTPATQGLHVGVRLPVEEAFAPKYFADVALLFFDDGFGTALQVGARADIGGRTGPFEYRLATELRRSPFSAKPQVWGGIELGFATTIFQRSLHPPSRKDSLHYALKPIATPEELAQFDSVPSANVDQWLDGFWGSHEFLGTTGKNARAEYMHRVQIANEKFGNEHHLGTITDKGKVLLRWGEAEHIETAYSTLHPDRKYELWVYYDRVQGHKTALFLFLQPEGPTGTARGVKFSGPGGFEEVFSNIPGEPSYGIPQDLPVAMYNYIESHSH